MKTWNSALFVVLAVALCAFMLNVPVSAQQPTPSSPNAAQDQSNQPMSGAMDHSEKTFTGKIVKEGGKLVLTDASGKGSYQLDDQSKAKDFVNKNVKVKGTLDNSTATIHVSAIEPV